MSTSILFSTLLWTIIAASGVVAKPRVVGTGSSRRCYDDAGNAIACPVNKTAIIIGVVVGVVGLIALTILVLVILRRRRNMRRAAAALPTHRGPSFEKPSVAHDGVNPPQPALVSDNKGINRFFGHNQPPSTAPVGTYAPPSGPPPA
ncbi:SubName: Full=Uncharacterized protein {ECO:0000313/EMBL:CCA69540.1} [Serendipita indica DSM 11827]|uniref:Mid2 domain-containing protein n=1 Tax=Serendipita indica (strain DSM 11827) TaxID=1109443 RepID=G4TE02_SERID|nr:SubName: Full=Uncharacterized protein {ECO:0000313/EMBL:CCA69540.1} [Serendipita indica DSM 11827]CCA69540.1 hypothetical protein PIIN_03479 [Serendipita indica DSM 11827]